MAVTMNNVAPLFQNFNSYNEFLEAVDKAFQHPSASKYRYGQLYFNMLDKYRPDLTEKIRGTALDPFQKEEVTKETHQFAINNWWGCINTL